MLPLRRLPQFPQLQSLKTRSFSALRPSHFHARGQSRHLTPSHQHTYISGNSRPTKISHVLLENFYSPPTQWRASTKQPATGHLKPPTSGSLSLFPVSWVPYAELTRIDKPTGTIYLLLPTLWSTLMAASLTIPTAPVSSVLYTGFLFTSGALIMRGAGCTINDL